MEFDKDYKQACADYVKAQKAMGKAIRQSTNPHFKSKYVDLQGVLDACGDASHQIDVDDAVAHREGVVANCFAWGETTAVGIGDCETCVLAFEL